MNQKRPYAGIAVFWVPGRYAYIPHLRAKPEALQEALKRYGVKK